MLRTLGEVMAAAESDVPAAIAMLIANAGPADQPLLGDRALALASILALLAICNEQRALRTLLMRLDEDADEA